MIKVFGFLITLPPELAFLANPLGAFTATAISWLIIAVVAYLLLTYVLRWVTHRLPGEVDDIILGIIRRPLLILLFAFGLISSLRALAMPENLTEWALRILLTAEILVGAWGAWMIHRRFQKEGIEIPFPQQDAWFRNALSTNG